MAVTDLTDEVFFKLFIKCSKDRLNKLIHHLIDVFCGQKSNHYESFSDLWTLLEWWDLIHSSKRFFLLYYSSFEKLPSLSSLPQEFQHALNDCLSLRHLDIKNKLIERTHEISPAYLHDFDWKVKFTLASDKMAQINEPRLLLNLDISGEKEKSLCLDLSKEELKTLIESMEKANEALQDFIISD